MTRTPITALLFAALLGAQASLALAAGTGPTNPGDGIQNPMPPGSGVDMTPNEPPIPSGTDPRTQGNDDGRQGGADTDGSRRQNTDGTGSDTSGSKGVGGKDTGGVSGSGGS